MGARARIALIAVAGAVLLAGCAVGPSQRPPVAVRGADATTAPPGTTAPANPDALPAPAPQNPRIGYTDCTADTLEATTVAGFPVPAGRALTAACGTIRVPADPAAPSGQPIRLGVLRVASADAPANRPALVVVGDSAGTGAGGGSARAAARLATLTSDAVLHQYQLVGLDRRGTGADLLDCALPAARAAVTDVPPLPDPALLGPLLEQARVVVQHCNLLLDSGLSAYRTASTAADLESLRAQLGVPTLDVVGIGDGASAVAAWASAHPAAVGRVVLDSPVDLVADEPQRSEARAGAAETAFDAFAAACLARGGCPLGPDPRAAVGGVLRTLEARPLASVDGDQVTAGGTVAALRAGLTEPARWPALAAALAAAGTGDPAGLIPFLGPVLRDGGTFDGELATSCNDTSLRPAVSDVAQLAQRWAAQYPLFGAEAAHRLLACAPWPATPGAGQKLGALPPQAPPVLVLGTAADPRSPQTGARAVAQLLGRTAFVGWQGSGQGAYPRSACVNALVEQVLVAGSLPRDGTVCPA